MYLGILLAYKNGSGRLLSKIHALRTHGEVDYVSSTKHNFCPAKWTMNPI